MARFKEFGYSNFSWVELEAFELRSGKKFEYFEACLLRDSIVILENSMIYKDDAAPPPYLSGEYKKRRDLAIQVINRAKK